MFVALGLKNAWRNRGRTALGIVSMAVAAVIFMSSSTLSKGYPAGGYWRARQLIGGEILMFPERIALSTDVLSAGGFTWEFGRKSYDQPTSAMGFDPTPYWYGGMRGVPAEDTINPDRLAEAVDRLREDPFVAGVSVRKSIPFLAQISDSQGTFFTYGFVEPRDVEMDATVYRMGESLNGRYLEPEDFMKGVRVRWQNVVLASGSMIEVPRASKTGYDYENSVSVHLEIVGDVSFSDPGPGPSYGNPVVFVTPETFETIRASAGFSDDQVTWGISVSVDNMSDLENYVGTLRRQFPDFTVYSVSQLATAASSREPVAAGVPMDMRRVTEVLSFMIAALLSATNLSVLMLARKNEIGILRALGATRWNITSMVLSESIWIAFLGSVIGGLLTQPAVLWQFLSNKVGSNVVAGIVGANMGKALGFSVAAAVLFGFLPVAKALKVTPAQVLRGD